MSKRAKFVLVTWVGPNVSVMKKAKMSTDKALMKDVIQVIVNSRKCNFFFPKYFPKIKKRINKYSTILISFIIIFNGLIEVNYATNFIGTDLNPKFNYLSKIDGTFFFHSRNYVRFLFVFN